MTKHTTLTLAAVMGFAISLFASGHYAYAQENTPLNVDAAISNSAPSENPQCDEIRESVIKGFKKLGKDLLPIFVQVARLSNCSMSEDELNLIAGSEPWVWH